MTQKLATLLSSTTSLLTPKALKLSLVSLGVLTATQQLQAAEQEWWFDVEVILFERTLEPNVVSESFKQSSLTPKTVNTLDILSHYLTPDTSYLIAGLPYCRTSKREEVTSAEQQQFVIPNMQWVDKIGSAIDELVLPEPIPDTQIEPDIASIAFDVTDNKTLIDSDTDINVSEVLDLTTAQDEAEHYVSQLTKMSYLEWRIPQQLPCAYSEQIDPRLVLSPQENTPHQSDLIAKVPVKINGIEWQTKMPAFLLPETTFRMDELYQSIKYQRGITPLLHLAWRQQVNYGRENTQPIRLFSGKNYGNAYTNSGDLRPQDTDMLFDSLSPSEEDIYIPEAEKLLGLSPIESVIDNTEDQSGTELFLAIEQALDDSTDLNLSELTTPSSELTLENEEQSTQAADIWQIDGEVAVYLRNVGRVPYLHIDSDLDYRHPVVKLDESLVSSETTSISENYEQANFLESVNFDQLRRVISKQVHYFDHPLFGMVVTINRYKWPEVKAETEQTNIE